jgi:hypothetical protein
MGMTPSAKMRTRGFEVGRLALSDLVNVNGVFTGRKILDINGDFDPLGRGRQNRSADALALRILDVHGGGLCSGAGTTVLHKNQTCCWQKQRGT